MSHLQYFNYAGWGEFGAWITSQAVRVGDRILISGQGGWYPSKTKKEDIDMENLIPTNLEEEVAHAFENVDIALKKAGGKGWAGVFRVISYSTNIAEQNDLIMKNIQKWCPDHKPCWTEIGVDHLAFPSMHIEIEVEAHDP